MIHQRIAKSREWLSVTEANEGFVNLDHIRLQSEKRLVYFLEKVAQL